MIQTAQSGSLSIYGRLDQIITQDYSIDTGSMITTAQGVVNSQGVPVEVIEITDPTPEAPQPFFDYRMGTIIFASCNAGSMAFTDRQLRVFGIDIVIDQEDNLAVKLTTANWSFA